MSYRIVVNRDGCPPDACPWPAPTQGHALEQAEMIWQDHFRFGTWLGLRSIDIQTIPEEPTK